jgi:hypothetical protein
MTIKNHQEVEDIIAAEFYEAAEKSGLIYSRVVAEKSIRCAVRSTFEILSRMDDKDIVEFVRKGK